MKTKVLLLFIGIAAVLMLMITKAHAMSAAKENNLAGNYIAGIGVPQSHAKATYWWKKAAAQGNFQAKYNLKN